MIYSLTAAVILALPLLIAGAQVPVHLIIYCSTLDYYIPIVRPLGQVTNTATCDDFPPDLRSTVIDCIVAEPTKKVRLEQAESFNLRKGIPIA